MPQTIPAIIQVAGTIAASNAGIVGSVAGALGVSTQAAAAIIGFGSSALAAGASLLLRPDQPRPRASRALRRTSQGVGYRFAALGRVRSAGDLVWFDADSDGDLWQLVIVSYRPISGYVAHYVDGEEVTLDEDGWVTTPGKWAGLIQIQTRRGTHVNLFPDVVDRFSYLSAADAGRGCAIVAVRQRPVGDGALDRTYPTRLVEYSTLVDGAPLPEPVPGLPLSASRNAARAVLWHLTDDDIGYGLPESAIDLDSFAAYAAVCDEQVQSRVNGLEPRYTASGVVDYSQERRQVLVDLLATCDADLVTGRDGRLRLIPWGGSGAPRVLTDDDVIEIVTRTGPVGEARRYTAVTPIYVDPARGWVETSAPTHDLPGVGPDLARISYQLALPYVTSSSQAQRIARRHLYRLAPEAVAEIVATSAARNVLPGDLVDVGLTYGLIDGPARVISREISADGQRVRLTVERYSDEREAWTIENELDTPPGPIYDASGNIVGPPVVTSTQIIETAINAATPAARIRVNFEPVDNSVRVEIEHASAGTGDWEGRRSRSAGTGWIQTEILPDGESYDVRVRFVTGGGLATDWVVVSAQTVIADSTPPPQVVLSGAAGGIQPGSISLTVTTPDAGNYYDTEVRYIVGTTTDWDAGTVWGEILTEQRGVSEEITITGLIGSTVYTVMAASRNVSGVIATPVASATATSSPDI